MAKRAAVKKIEADVRDGSGKWVARFGKLDPGRGRQTAVPNLFQVVGEKLSFEALSAVDKHLGILASKGIRRKGVYVAHESMGYARYIWRGGIFPRLRACLSKHSSELVYFSFYIVKEKQHEREIEPLLIHSAGPLLQFNTKKKDLPRAPGIFLTTKPGLCSSCGPIKKERSQEGGDSATAGDKSSPLFASRPPRMVKPSRGPRS